MKYELAKDVQEMLEDILDVMDWRHIIGSRIICVRSFGSKSNAYARIWAFPKIWQVALDIGPFYVIEVIHEHFDKLSEKEKIKTLIHELLHIPKRFTGGLVGHKQAGITARREEALFREYKKRGGIFG